MILAYFRPNPDDQKVCELVVAIEGRVHKIPWPRKKCIDSIRNLLPFVEAQ